MTSHRSPDKRGIDIYTDDHEYIQWLSTQTGYETNADVVQVLILVYKETVAELEAIRDKIKMENAAQTGSDEDSGMAGLGALFG